MNIQKPIICINILIPKLFLTPFLTSFLKMSLHLHINFFLVYLVHAQGNDLNIIKKKFNILKDFFEDFCENISKDILPKAVP